MKKTPPSCIINALFLRAAARADGRHLKVNGIMDCFLEEKMDAINRQYFRLAELPSIRWSRGSVKRRYRKITFGSYDFKRNQIRIHPVLKKPDIPAIVLEYVLFHELLHFQDRETLNEAYALPKRIFGRRRVKVHSRTFHEREKEYPRKKEASRIMRHIACGTFRAEADVPESLFQSAG